jgi:2,3-bisphosphoglycerate-independent phosphoglycerate mutase
VLEGLLAFWDLDQDLILVTSDHGNMEDLSTRRHTPAKVPGLVIGRAHPQFTENLVDLTGIAGQIMNLLGEEHARM